jgi:hypothetical protein
MVSTGCHQDNITLLTPLKSRQASDEKASPLAESNAPQQDTEKTQVQSDAPKGIPGEIESLSQGCNEAKREDTRGSGQASEDKTSPLAESIPPQQNREETMVQLKGSPGDIEASSEDCNQITQEERRGSGKKSDDKKDPPLAECNPVPPLQNRKQRKAQADAPKESPGDSASSERSQKVKVKENKGVRQKVF